MDKDRMLCMACTTFSLRLVEAIVRKLGLFWTQRRRKGIAKRVFLSLSRSLWKYKKSCRKVRATRKKSSSCVVNVALYVASRDSNVSIVQRRSGSAFFSSYHSLEKIPRLVAQVEIIATTNVKYIGHMLLLYVDRFIYFSSNDFQH